MYENLLPRFLRYVKTETRSDATSQTTPSTQTQVAFAKTLQKEMEELGLHDVHYNEENGFVIGTLPIMFPNQFVPLDLSHIWIRRILTR